MIWRDELSSRLEDEINFLLQAMGSHEEDANIISVQLCTAYNAFTRLKTQILFKGICGITDVFDRLS